MIAIKYVRETPAITKVRLFSLLLLAAVIFVVGPRPANAQANIDGVWSPVADWPLIAVHAAITPDGRVLTYGTDGAGKQTGYFIYDIWDPSAGLEGGHFTLNNMTLTDIFCSSQVILPQSEEILIAGGDNWTGTGTTNTGNNNSNLFDWSDNTLARSNNMNRARWYSSATVLIDGSIYIQGGSSGADRPEVREDNGTFRLLTNAATNGYAALFPRNFLAPDGRVFGYDTNGKMYFVSTGGTGSIAAVGQFPSANAGWTSGAAMFRPGQILQTGGNSNGAIVIDINGPQPTVTATQSASTHRQWVSATVLPDGKVLATGGSQVANTLTGVNNSAEIWDPATGQWRRGSDGALARLYHSSALLLPDATVLIAGGGAPGPLNNTNAEIYYPPYLFDVDGQPALRPQILNAPSSADVGDVLTIEVDSAVSRVTIVKSGSVTHSVNMDQRFIELPFTSAPGLVYAELPSRTTDTPPGFYHVFVFNDAGVPAKASMLKINVDSTPNTAVDYTPTIGGGGGAPFQLACDSDQVLVGIHGRFATYVNQVGPQCVAIDQFGRWIGDPVTKPVTGTTTSGTSFDKLCPRDSAMSGFRGQSAQYVDQIEIECRALTPSGGLTGSGQFLGAVGGPNGTPQALSSCGTGNPVYALYGRSGGWLDAFGVQCRPGAITPIATNSSPVIVNPGAQTSVVGIAVDLQLQASDGDNDPLTFDVLGLPPGLSTSTQGRISGTPTAAGNFSVSVTVSDGTESRTISFEWLVEQVEALAVEPMTSQPPSPVDTLLAFAATAHGGVNVRYKWQFGDGSPETPYSASPSIEHAYMSPGIYFITLTATDDLGVPSTQSFAQTIHLPLTEFSPRNSTNVAYEVTGGGARIWAVNQDNDTVSVFDAATNTRLTEIAVGSAPRTVAVAPNGAVWITNKRDSSISIVNPTTLGVALTVLLPSGTAPYGLVFSPVANQAFVVLEGNGELVVLDATNGDVLDTVDVGEHARHVSIDSTGTTLYVSRFITPPQPGEDSGIISTEIGGIPVGGEVLVLDANTLTPTSTVVLRHGDKPDAENQGSGVPNYLGAVAISPDGVTATVPSKQDNIGRGTLRSGANLNFQNTVRAISSRIDLAVATEDYGRRIDHDDASLASAVAYDPYGIYMFVALETSREIAVVDAHGGFEMFRFDVGRAPQGLVVSPDGKRLYVSNFMDRTIDILDLTDLVNAGQWNVTKISTVASVVTEKLEPTVLLGKQLFYDARDTRLARDRYMSCASCHNDGGYDGRVWDLTGMGEGLRNTISLQGTAAAHGPLHWSQNFDEVQDFEGQIRALAGGTGLMSNSAFLVGTRSEPLGDPKAGVSSDLDALAAYVASLDEFPVTPYRDTDGSLTVAGEAGRAVFMRENCAGCHADTSFTDSAAGNLRDIGTMKAASGMRLGGQLDGIDTPTLRAVWHTPPYLHDGSAGTLAEAVAAHAGVALDASDMSELVEYLKQIDADEIIAPQSTLYESIWDSTATPTILAAADSAVQVGVKFRASVDGAVTGVRFYKGPGNTGTHVGSLWSASGSRLASAVFTNETETGWQQVDFDVPVPVVAGTVYIASYHAPNGNYSADIDYFKDSGVTQGSLYLLKDGETGGNGVYAYGTAGTYPAASFRSANYWVDVVFTAGEIQPPSDTQAPTVSSYSPANGVSNASLSATVTATFSEAMDPATINPTTFELRDAANAIVPGAVGYDVATRTVTLTPNAALTPESTYTATVRGGTSDPRAKDLAANALAANVSWSFTTSADVACPCTGWDGGATPAMASAPDSNAVELGVKFRVDVDGSVTGIRFYKGAGNSGEHVGNLWSTSGELLATAIFTNETSTGWQQVNFSTPVTIAADTVYVASYHAPNGHYSANSAYFSANGVDNGVLHLLQNGESGGNGLYAYSTSSVFPTQSYNSSNYWVDVVFDDNAGEPPVDDVAPAVLSHTPATDASNVAPNTNVTVTFDEAIDPTSIGPNTFELRDASNQLVPAAVNYNAASRTVMLNPGTDLAESASYIMTLRGGAVDPRIKDLAGNALASDIVWSFTTAAGIACPCSAWDDTAVPQFATVPDSSAVELGVKFRVEVDGFITGVRFYKGPGNTGQHVGNLWSASGELLASAIFANETTSGWQEVTFSAPVSVTAGTVYVASYHAPNGNYSADAAYFVDDGVDSAALRLLRNGESGGNGVYAYDTVSTFPTYSYNGNNYWVDVVFVN